MDSASREKRKRMDSHTVRRSAPAPPLDTVRAGQVGPPSAQALQQMQQLGLTYYCENCKSLCMALEHAEGPELPNTTRCTACGSIAQPVDPAAVSPCPSILQMNSLVLPFLSMDAQQHEKTFAVHATRDSQICQFLA